MNGKEQRTYNEMLVVLKELFAAYPLAPVDEKTILMYLRLLAHIPTDELRMAVYHCVSNMKFLPGVSELREAHRLLTGGMIEETATEAWETVEREIRRTGSWGSPQFENETTQRVVEMMGWRNLCMSDKPAVERAQFLKLYDSLSARIAEADHMLPEVRSFYESRVQKRLTQSGKVGGLSTELKRLGLIEGDNDE